MDDFPDIDYSVLPEHMRGGMKRYIEQGIRPGDFLYLILINDFVHALGHADNINTVRIVDYARFLHWELPMDCWGSKEKVKKWMEQRQEQKLKAREAKEGHIPT